MWEPGDSGGRSRAATVGAAPPLFGRTRVVQLFEPSSEHRHGSRPTQEGRTARGILGAGCSHSCVRLRGPTEQGPTSPARRGAARGPQPGVARQHHGDVAGAEATSSSPRGTGMARPVGKAARQEGAGLRAVVQQGELAAAQQGSLGAAGERGAPRTTGHLARPDDLAGQGLVRHRHRGHGDTGTTSATGPPSGGSG